MSFNVIGLISGGKDSLYSLSHCIQNGHKVVALANLYPQSAGHPSGQGEDEGTDINSLMYQTVGHSIIPLYAEALGLPLYRRATKGIAKHAGRYYNTNGTDLVSDEIEDMFLLIKEVLEHHPEANALNAGAILSTYQRTRVESVAIRLGLTPLAYLWQYPALPPPVLREDSLTGLLDDMDLAHCNARIIKIASGGIQSDFLSYDVTSSKARSRLVSGLGSFFEGQEFWLRGAVLGEAGEYETLALDGPSSLWKMRIEFESTASLEAEGGIIYTRFDRAYVTAKDAPSKTTIPVPVLLDSRFAAIQSQLTKTTLDSNTIANSSQPSIATQPSVNLAVLVSSNTVEIHNLTASGATPAQQFEQILTDLARLTSTITAKNNLPMSSLALQNIVSTTLLLNSIDCFASINQMYTAKLWPQGLPNPPARVTVAAPLPAGTDVALSVTFSLNEDLDRHGRKGLHVQSRSYWAPANIGPYSQAISVPVLTPSPCQTADDQTNFGKNTSIEVVHMAGQIPLLPSSMNLLEGKFSEQAVLAIQHLWRVGQEREVDLWVGAGVAYLNHHEDAVHNMHDSVLQNVNEAATIWQLAHQVDEKGNNRFMLEDSSAGESQDANASDEEDIDIWDLQQRHRGFGSAPFKPTIGEHLHKLPNEGIFSNDTNLAHRLRKAGIKVSDSGNGQISTIPTFIAVEVSGLPRNAPIEWWSTGLAGLVSPTGNIISKVLPIKKSLMECSWLSGIVIEHKTPETIDEDDNEVPNSFSFFLTLVIDSRFHDGNTSHLPSCVKDLQEFLVEPGMQLELVTAHSFINLSGDSHLMEAVMDMELIQKSTVVPCYHVWSTTKDHGSVVTEVMAAVVLRIDAIGKPR